MFIKNSDFHAKAFNKKRLLNLYSDICPHSSRNDICTPIVAQFHHSELVHTLQYKLNNFKYNHVFLSFPSDQIQQYMQ